MTATREPDLASLLADPVGAAQVPPEAVPKLLGELERLRATLWQRLMLSQAASSPTRPGTEPSSDDDLLTAASAAQLLGMSRDWLYKNAPKLPFTRRVGVRAVRFSARAIRRYLAARS